MPVRKVKGGYRWGSKGKVYKTKAEAEKARSCDQGCLGIRERSNGWNFTIINCWSESR